MRASTKFCTILWRRIHNNLYSVDGSPLFSTWNNFLCALVSEAGESNLDWKVRLWRLDSVLLPVLQLEGTRMVVPSSRASAAIPKGKEQPRVIHRSFLFCREYYQTEGAIVLGWLLLPVL
jgi:hypothetical protein